MPPTRGNLLFDSISLNTGDIAIGIAGRQVLDSFSIPSTIINPFEATVPSPLIIGGGELIRTEHDPFYDAFRRQGRHILNAAGVWSTADNLDYLRQYSFVSARSEREAQVLREWVPSAEVVPCATTMLQSDHYDIPGVDPGETVVGIHMVPHSIRLIADLIPMINAIPHKKVFIPFTHYNGDASFMKTLPFDRSNSVFLDKLEPLQLHSVIGQMSYVVVSSLHASIFAYSQNVPFAAVHQKKAQYYFQDRGLGGNLVSNKMELAANLQRLDTERADYSSLIAADRERISEAFARYVAILAESEDDSSAWRPTAVPATSPEDLVLFDQAQRVIGDRDLALAYVESRRIEEQANAARTGAELEATRTQLKALQDVWWVRFVHTSARRGRRALAPLRRLPAMFKRS